MQCVSAVSAVSTGDQLQATSYKRPATSDQLQATCIAAVGADAAASAAASAAPPAAADAACNEGGGGEGGGWCYADNFLQRGEHQQSSIIGLGIVGVCAVREGGRGEKVGE